MEIILELSYSRWTLPMSERKKMNNYEVEKIDSYETVETNSYERISSQVA